MNVNLEHILLVEDNPAHAGLIRRAFEAVELDVNLVTLPDVHQARLYLSRSIPDMLITDLNLPDGSGLELLPENDGLPAYPVLLITSRHNQKLAASKVQPQAVDYVVKSDAILADMPHISQRVYRNWQLAIERERTESALQVSEQRFHHLFAHVPVAIWEEDFSLVGRWMEQLRQQGVRSIKTYLAEHPEARQHALSLVRVLDVNAAAIETLDAKSKQQAIDQFSHVLDSDTEDALTLELAAFWKGSPRFEHETTGETLAGERQHKYVQGAAPLKDGKVDLSRVLVAVSDITQLKQAEQRLSIQNDVLEMIALGEPLSNILERLCILVEQVVPNAWCAVMLLDEDTGDLNIEAGPSFSPEVLQAFRGLVPGERAGSCGTAAFCGKMVIVEDTRIDPRWSEMQDVVRRFGIHSCWSIPIFGDGPQVVGTFSISHATPRNPTPLHHHLLETASHLAGIAIQRQRIEEGTRQSEQRFRVLYEHNPTMYFTVAPDGTVLSVNPFGADQLGYTVDELIGRSVQDIFHPEDREAALQGLRDCFEHPGRVAHWELRKVRENGGIIWVKETARAVDRPEGDRVLLVVCEDITERRATDQSLRQKNAHLRLLQLVAVAANEAQSMELALQSILDEVCAHTNWPVGHVYVPDEDRPDELKPTTLWHLSHPERFKAFRMVTETTRFPIGVGLPGRVLASKKPAWICDVSHDPNFPRYKLAENIGVRAGFAFPVLVGRRVAAVLEFFSSDPAQPDDALLEIMAYVGTQLGRVMERTSAEAALRDREEQYRSTFDQAAMGIAHVDANGRFVRVNPSLCQIFGYTHDELVSMRFSDVTHPDDLAMSFEEFQRLVKGEIDPLKAEKRYLRKDKTVVWANLTATSLRTSAGDLKYSIALVEDITQRKRAEKERAKLESELRHTQKLEAVGMLASGVAHDFNNLLTAINGYVELAGKNLSNDHPSVESLNMISQAAQQAIDVSDSLLMFARKSTIEKLPVDLADLVGESLRLLRRLFPSSVETVETLPPGKTVWVVGYRTALQQVVMNLALNARDAMPQGGKLHVHLGVEQAADSEGRADPSMLDRTAVLVVEDTGTGMTDEILTHIYDPFFTTKERGEGTGLGLSVVQRIVADHHGQISVHSQPSRGTRFVVRLPTCQSPVLAQPAVGTAYAQTPLSQRIIVAQENDYVREIIISTLESVGYDVIVADDGDTLFQQLRLHGGQIRLVVVDLDLPKNAGATALTQIARTWPSLPTLVIGADTDVFSDGAGLTAEHRLIKPFQMSQLLTMVYRLLKGKTSTVQLEKTP